MTNQERAAEVIWEEQWAGIVKPRDLVETLADDDLLISDLPERELSGFWEVGGLEINPANKDGEVLIEWEDESDYSYYGTQTRTLWLNRQQVLAIVAAAKPRKGN